MSVNREDLHQLPDSAEIKLEIKESKESNVPRGGFRVNAGRKPGALEKLKKRVEAVGIERSVAAVEGGQTPLEFLLEVMRDIGVDTESRIDAAKAAAVYVHRKQPQAHEVDTNVHMEAVEFVVLGGTLPKGA